MSIVFFCYLYILTIKDNNKVKKYNSDLNFKSELIVSEALNVIFYSAL